MPGGRRRKGSRKQNVNNLNINGGNGLILGQEPDVYMSKNKNEQYNDFELNWYTEVCKNQEKEIQFLNEKLYILSINMCIHYTNDFHLIDMMKLSELKT